MGKTDIGGVVGVGGTFKVGSTMGTRVDVEDNIFSAKFKGATGGDETESSFNNDLAVTLGLSIQFGGGGR